MSLARRSDRRARFFANTSFAHSDVHVLDAFDGQQLQWSDGLRRLFSHNTFNDRRTLAAQALSHFVLWRHISTTTDQFHLILEDDQTLPTGFIELWNSRFAWSFPLDADVVFLGGVDASQLSAHAAVLRPVTRAFATHAPNTLFLGEFDEGIDTGNSTEPTPTFLYHTHAYILSSKAARALELMIGSHGFRRPVAHMLMKIQRSLRVYVTTPLLASTVAVHPASNGIDSDVQYDFTRLPEPGVPAELSFAYPPAHSGLPLPHINTLGYGLLLPTLALTRNESSTAYALFNASLSSVCLFFALAYTSLQDQTMH